MQKSRLAITTLAALGVCAFAAGPAAAAPTWAPAASAPSTGRADLHRRRAVHRQLRLYDASNVYIGQAAHCSGTGAATSTDGCTSQSLPEGTPVDVTGASKPGTMVYNSWIRMQAAGEKDPDTCAYNDLALVRLDPADAAKVNRRSRFWGGPQGIDTDGTQLKDQVESYGNSELRGGVSALSPKDGYSLGDDGNGWSHNVYTATPGIPGDSGSAFINDKGQASACSAPSRSLRRPAPTASATSTRKLAWAGSTASP